MTSKPNHSFIWLCISYVMSVVMLNKAQEYSRISEENFQTHILLSCSIGCRILTVPLLNEMRILLRGSWVKKTLALSGCALIQNKDTFLSHITHAPFNKPQNTEVNVFTCRANLQIRGKNLSVSIGLCLCCLWWP